MAVRHVVIVLIMLSMLVPLGSLAAGIVAGPAPLVIAASAPRTLGTGNAVRGQQIYAISCAGCHAPEARLAPPHNSAEFRARYPTDTSIAVVVRSGRHPMPGFTPSELDDQALADLISYLMSLK